MQNSTFARLRDLHFPAFLLHEQMRMPQGMMHLSNDTVYDKKLSDGSNTLLRDHHEARALKDYLRKMYPSMVEEPGELIYPVMLNVHGESQLEASSQSVCNHYHVTATIGEIIKLLKGHANANPANIGIATPYRAQIRLYHRALQSAHKKLPDLKLFETNVSVIRVGTAEYWQGKEIPYVFADLVRASNDAGNLGFFSHTRRLNVAVTVAEIIKLLQGHPHANSGKVGIATPYRAQLRLYRQAIKKADKHLSELKLRTADVALVRSGIAEFW